MAFPAVTTASPANIKSAAVLAVYVKDTTGSKWQTLGAITQGVLHCQNFEGSDSQGRNRSLTVWNFTASCRMMQTSVAALEKLDTLTDGTNAFLFKLTDAATVTTSAAYAGWVGVTAAQVSCKAKLVADGTPEDPRYVEVMWQGSIYISTANQIALFTPTLETGDFEATGGSGTMHAFGTYTVATDGGSPILTDIRGCGVSTYTLDLIGGSSPVTMSPIQNVKMTFEQLATEDSLRRFLPNSMDINIEIDWMATDSADILLLDDMLPLEIKAIVTMIDSVAFTLNNQVGISLNYEVLGDMDKNRVIRFTHKGKILNSSFDGVVA